MFSIVIYNNLCVLFHVYVSIFFSLRFLFSLYLYVSMYVYTLYIYRYLYMYYCCDFSLKHVVARSLFHTASVYTHRRLWYCAKLDRISLPRALHSSLSLSLSSSLLPLTRRKRHHTRGFSFIPLSRQAYIRDASPMIFN